LIGHVSKSHVQTKERPRASPKALCAGRHNSAPGLRPGACVAGNVAKKAVQRFDFLAFFFFLVAFLADFFAEDFFEDFLAAFFALDFFAAFFFGITFLAAFLAAFLTFLTTAFTASFVASAALLIASVVCSRTGFSSSISSPRVYRCNNDSGIRRAVKATTTRTGWSGWKVAAEALRGNADLLRHLSDLANRGLGRRLRTGWLSGVQLKG